MPPKKKDPRKQYFESIKTQKIDTLRWCLRHGGVSAKAMDEDGHTGAQSLRPAASPNRRDFNRECAQGRRAGRFRGARRGRPHAADDGRAYNGKLDCCRLLVLQGKAKMTTKCDAGKTARMYAESRKTPAHEKVIAFLDNPTAPPPEEEEDDDEVDEEEEQRKRVFKASQRSAGQATQAAQQEEVHRQRVEAAEALEKALASSAPPIWPEVEPILKETRRELSIRNKPPLTVASGPIDPAVWNCVCLFELRLELAERSLTRLPPQISRLCDLVTLIVSNNALSELPEEVSQLAKLRNLRRQATS